MLGKPNNLRDMWNGMINEFLSMASVNTQDNLILVLLLITYQTPKLSFTFIPQSNFHNSILGLQVTLSDLPCAEIPHLTLNQMKTYNRQSLGGGSNGVKQQYPSNSCSFLCSHTHAQQMKHTKRGAHTGHVSWFYLVVHATVIVIMSWRAWRGQVWVVRCPTVITMMVWWFHKSIHSWFTSFHRQCIELHSRCDVAW